MNNKEESKTLKFEYFLSSTCNYKIELISKNLELTIVFIDLVNKDKSNNNLKYESSFNLDYIKQKNDYFSWIHTLSELQDFFKQIITNRKLEIKKDRNYIKSLWVFPKGFKEGSLELIITLSKSDIYSQLSNLIKENQSLKEEVSTMKAHMKQKEKDFQLFQDRVIEEINNLKYLLGCQQNNMDTSNDSISNLVNSIEQVNKSSSKKSKENEEDNNKDEKVDIDKLKLDGNFNTGLIGTTFEKSIIKNVDEILYLRSCINGDDNPYTKKEIKSFNLLYKATRDGDELQKLCDLCGENSPTIILFHTKNQKRFGAYTENLWGRTLTSSSVIEKDKNAFLFSLDGRKRYKTKTGKTGIFYHKLSLGFGHVNDDFNKLNKSELYFSDRFLSKKSYECDCKEAFMPRYCDLSEEKEFFIFELEVYLVEYCS